MKWSEFYDEYFEWSESTVSSCISGLDSIGSGEEIVEVVFDLPSDKLKNQLIRKAIRMKASFTHNDFEELYGEISDSVYDELALYCGYDADNPYFDENNLSWQDFNDNYWDWSDSDVLRRIRMIKNFGSTEEVYETICCMPNSECADALYQKSVAAGVKFNNEQLYDMGIIDEIPETEAIIEEEDIDEMFEIPYFEEESVSARTPRRRGVGLLGAGFVALGLIGASKRKQSGSCINEKPHYGYRYGRWYYGRGHRHGCQRGGNGNDPMRTSRD